MAQTKKAEGRNAPQDPLACSLTNASVCLASVVYAFTVGLGSGLAYVGGFMLDVSVSLSLNSAAYALSFLSSGWTTARDLANMAFILILVYIAFIIMFQAETAGTIKMLAWVIFIALIINFSFFFTRVVIDVSNILAVQFYNSIPGGTMQQSFDTTTSNTGTLASGATGIAKSVAPDNVFQNTKDLTASIMNALNIQELFNNASFKKWAGDSSFGSKFIVLAFLYIAVGACYFILAAMFFAVAIKFIVRVVVLWFLIIASPLAFICKAMPPSSGMSGWYDRWQSELVSHAFYPAFFLFIFFFIATIMSSFTGKNSIMAGLATDLSALLVKPDLSAIIYIASLVATVGIRLGFVVAMLYIALKASEHMGVRGGEIAHRATSFAFGQTGRLAALPGRVIGQNTFGRAGNALANNKYLATRAATGSNILTRGAWRSLDRTTKATGTAFGKASYDLRNAPGASILKKGVEKISGSAVSAGSPAAGGFMAQKKERAERIKKEQAERAKLIKEAEGMNIVKELIEKSERHETLEATQRRGGTLTPDETKEKRTLKVDLEKLSNKFNSLSKEQTDTVKLADMEKVLKHGKEGIIKKIEESEKRTDKEKADIRDKWEDASVQHAQNIIKNLGQIHTDLTTHGSVPTASLVVLKASTQPSMIIDDDQVKDLLKELKREIPLARGRMTAAAMPADKERERENIRVLQEARDYVSQMDIIRKGIPDGKGGAFKAGEFVVA